MQQSSRGQSSTPMFPSLVTQMSNEPRGRLLPGTGYKFPENTINTVTKASTNNRNKYKVNKYLCFTPVYRWRNLELVDSEAAGDSDVSR